ncbi:MAG: hypothetical protein ACO1RX_07050 [Candidatus Sericytochromatia bacterium]
MKNAKAPRWMMSLTLTGLLCLTACGSSRDLGVGMVDDLSAMTPTITPPSSSSNSELAIAIPKILAGLEDIKAEIRALEIRSTDAPTSSTTRPSTSTTPKPTTPKPGTTAPKPSTATPKPSTPAKPSAAAQGEAALKAILNKINTSPYVQLTAEKNEKNLATGKVSYNKIEMWSKQPNVMKINILKSSSGSEGVSAMYTSGVGTKIQVKKLFIKLDLDKTDERVASNNGYLADDIDLFGIAKRYSSGGYSATLIGTTQLAGKTINIIKVTTTGTNTMDARITHEYLGYEPDTYAVRLFELYNDAAAKEPYYRMTLPAISFPTSLPDSTFKL